MPAFANVARRNPPARGVSHFNGPFGRNGLALVSVVLEGAVLQPPESPQPGRKLDVDSRLCVPEGVQEHFDTAGRGDLEASLALDNEGQHGAPYETCGLYRLEACQWCGPCTPEANPIESITCDPHFVDQAEGAPPD
jgi:hypothetical protein